MARLIRPLNLPTFKLANLQTYKPATAGALKRARVQLILIIALSILLRLATALYLGDDTANHIGGTYDQVSYDALAQRLLAGHGFSFAQAWWPATAAGEPTAHWSYIYTIFLAAVYALFGHHPLAARLIQALLTGLLLPWLTYRVGRRAFGRAAGLLSAAFIAVYFYFVLYSAALMTEAFYTVAILWLVDIAQRLSHHLQENASPAGGERRPLSRLTYGVQLGLATGAVILLRQVGLFIVVVVIAWLLWAAWRHDKARAVLKPLALSSILALLLLLPWAARNYRAFGTVSLLPNTNSGFALYWANHPIYGTQFQTVLSDDAGVSYQELIPPDLRDLNEARLDNALRRRGMQFIFDDVQRYALLSLSRVPIHFQFWPTPDSSLLANAARLLSFGLALPFILAGVALFLHRNLRNLTRRAFWLPQASGPTWTSRHTRVAHGAMQFARQGNTAQHNGALLLAIIIIYNLLHVLTWAKIRYRLPTDALMLMFAAYGILAIARGRRTAGGGRQMTT